MAQRPSTSNYPWCDIIACWRKAGVAILPGATASSIASFQSKYNVVLPFDFMEYIQTVNGTGADYSDDNITSFFSLEEIIPVHDALNDANGVIYPDRFLHPDCYIFSDHFLSSWFYAVKLTSNPEQAAPVYRVTASEAPIEIMAPSFREFMLMYAHNPDSFL